MAIGVDEAKRVWWLNGEHMSYAVGVDRHGALQHLHFGGLVASPTAADFRDADALYVLSSFEASEGYSQQEFPAQHGMYFYEPCLRLVYADHVRDTWLVYDSYRIEANEHWQELVLSLRDAHYDITVRLHYRLYPAYDLIARWTAIENHSAQPVRIEQALSALWSLPFGGQYRLTHLAGRHTEEFQIVQEPVSPGKKVIESRRGNTSHQANPWFAIDRGSATEDHGEVWFGALAWSGNWKIAVEQNTFGYTQVSGGIHDYDFAWHLDAGETFETPVFVGGYTAGGYGQASRNLHRYQRDMLLPDSTAPRPVIYNGWEAYFFDVSEANQLPLIERAAALGVELFCIDDGWFGARTFETAGLGDWWVNPDKFPNGLQPLIDRVHALDMKFGLWVEPEMVNPDSDLYRAHPDWVYHFPTRPRTEARNQLVLNLARDDVQEFIFATLDGLLRAYAIDFFKWDMNRSLTEPGWMDAPVERQREIWVRHVRALYRILSRLRAAHPHLRIESCSGGGGRVDMGILPFVDQFWTSDITDPHERVKVQEGFSMAYCARTMECWVPPTRHNVPNRDTSLAYRFHVSMMGALGIGADLNRWSEKDMHEARDLVAQYKAIRHIVQDGDLYRLRSLREGNLAAVQYVTRDRREAVLFVIRGLQEYRRPAAETIMLRGLDPDARYTLSGQDAPVSGAGLMSAGMAVPLWGDFQSQVFILKAQV